MEEVDHIIFHYLARLGVKFPDDVTRLSQFPAECVQGALNKCLDAIAAEPRDRPEPLNADADADTNADTLANKLLLADQIANKIKSLGYNESLACEQIVYPNEVTMRKLFMFLIGKTSRVSDAKYATTPRDSQTFLMTTISAAIARELRSVSTHNDDKTEHRTRGRSSLSSTISTDMNEEALAQQPLVSVDNIIQQLRINRHGHLGYNHIRVAAKYKPKSQTKASRQEIRDTMQNLNRLNEKKEQLLYALESKKKELSELNRKKDTFVLASNLAGDCEENLPKLLKIAEKETLKVEVISKEIEEKQKYIRDSNKDLRNAEEQLALAKNDLKTFQEKFEGFRDELELKCKVLEHLKRELDNRRNQMTRVKDRHSYTKKIMEILSHIEKQKVEVNKILSDTRAVQKEMNNVHGKFERSFMVVDEIIFQDAKKDEFARQLYKKVAEVRTTCDRISNKIADCGTCSCDIRSLTNTVNKEKMKNIASNINKANQDLTNIDK